MSFKSGLKLRSGAIMPILGLGTFMTKDQEVIGAVLKALEVGYRHIDTAYAYKNEKAIGEALEVAFDKGLLKREDLFVTTKLPPNGHSPDKVGNFLKQSLKALKLSYVDLYLIHNPMPFQYRKDEDIFPIENGVPLFADIPLVDTWKAMEAQVDAGLTKDIGISNFNSQQVKLICDNARIKPSTNQIEVHIFLQQEKLRQFCKDLGVTITAYAPFGSPGLKDWRKTTQNVDIPENPSVLNNEILVDIAKKHNKTSAQVALRWLVQRDIIVIPKSTNDARIEQNAQIFDFELSAEEMARIKTIDRGQRFFSMDFLKNVNENPNFPYNIEF